MTDKQKLQTIEWYHPAFLISTWFGIGKIPFAPGTWGSLFTFPLFVASHYLLVFVESEESFINLYLFSVVLLFVIGNWATSVYMKKTGKHDPKEVVIDEVAGQILVFFAAFISIAPSLQIFNVLYGLEGEAAVNITFATITQMFTEGPIAVSYWAIGLPIYLICFALFRLFDIWKPWPIRQCDKNIKGGFGVMFDDLFAAMYAIIVLYCLGLLISM